MTISQPFKRVIETTMAQVLTGLNMPTLAEMRSLAARMTNIEMRLDDLDDIKGAIQAISGTQHATPTAPKVKGGH
jgi:mannose/fructose-specific phosphotransferase system component IIA